MKRLTGNLFMLLATIGSSCGGLPEPQYLTPVPDAEAVGVFHKVRQGETLGSICRAYDATLQEVAEINGIEDPDTIMAGQRIFIPDAKSTATVSKGAGTSEDNVPIRKYHGRFIWPVEGGVLTSKFGIRHGRRHDGIDIAAPEGTRVRASAGGKVLYAGDQQRGYGNLVIIRHAKNMITVYAHNQKNLVKEGERVEQGDVIALVGKTGRATGPHLHFEIRKKTKPRNPLFFLPKTE